jgi:hypothetical protein
MTRPAADRVGSTPRAQADLTGLGEEIATKWERTVMDGGLQVVRTDAYHRGHDIGIDRTEHPATCVLANIDGIPNDGGGW